MKSIHDPGDEMKAVSSTQKGSVNLSSEALQRFYKMKHEKLILSQYVSLQNVNQRFCFIKTYGVQTEPKMYLKLKNYYCFVIISKFQKLFNFIFKLKMLKAFVSKHSLEEHVKVKV